MRYYNIQIEIIMKKIIHNIIICFTIPVSSLTQCGDVKTKGRIVNGKHIPGMGLPGTTINVHGLNSMRVRDPNGSSPRTNFILIINNSYIWFC